MHTREGIVRFVRSAGIVAVVAQGAMTRDIVAQEALTRLPRGTAVYQTVAAFQGQAMTPWTTEVRITDSTHEGRQVVVIARRAIREELNAVSENTVVLDPRTGDLLRMTGSHRGRVPIDYQLARADGRLVGHVVADGGHSETISEPVPTDAVPDIALGPMLAARDLHDGLAVAITVIRFNTALFRYPLRAVVTSGSVTRRGATAAEPVWVIEGGAEFRARVVIAKGDRTVLEVTLPQGMEGSQTETFAGGQR